jgi:hypothetical protein
LLKLLKRHKIEAEVEAEDKCIMMMKGKEKVGHVSPGLGCTETVQVWFG